MTSQAMRLPRVGIIGGGQLGKMMTQAGKKLGFTVWVLDPHPGSPAGQVADGEITGGFADRDRLRDLVTRCEVSTYDIEHIDTGIMRELVREGRRILPSPELLEIIQDKLIQKQKLQDHGLPVPRFVRVDEPAAQDIEDFGYPVVQKLRRGGYDGRAVALFRGPGDLGRLLPGPSMLEPLVDLDKELAVMVARGVDGEIRPYPVVEMEAHPTANLLDLLVAPARIPPEVAEAARDLACRTVEALDGVGVFGVELFLARDGELTVNEVAPRPHNSGHYTIEACLTSQFEQHLRAVTGLPLGATDLVMPAAMINLLGQPGQSGPQLVAGLREAMAIPGVAVHIYGKAETRPFRKMGHVTVLDPDVNEARAKALRVRDLLRIQAEV